MSSSHVLCELTSSQVAERRAIALRKGAAPPLRHSSCAAPSGSAAGATFVRPPRNQLPSHQTPESSDVQEADAPTGAVTMPGRAAPPKVPIAEGPVRAQSVYSVPASLQSRGVDRTSVPPSAAGAPAVTVMPACMPVMPRVQPVAQPMYSTRGLASMPPDALVNAFLETCVGRVGEAACTPQGKSLLQAVLRTEQPGVLKVVVTELCPCLGEVAVDVHGCHVLRTLVEACTAEQTEQLIDAMHPSVVLNMCTSSQYTRRTLQALFERRVVDLQKVVRVLAENAGYLAATQQGCISLMRVFELCDAEQKAELVSQLLPMLAALSMDAFANYMVQCAVEHSDRTTAAHYVMTHFAGKLLSMALDKFASNVLEKVLRCCGEVPAVRRAFLDELVYNPAALKETVSDLYGNFVIQSLVGVVTNPMEFKRMEDRLRPALVGCPFAAKVEAKVRAKRPMSTHAGGGALYNPHPNLTTLPQPFQPLVCPVSCPMPQYVDPRLLAGGAGATCVPTGLVCGGTDAFAPKQGYGYRPCDRLPLTSLPPAAEAMQPTKGHAPQPIRIPVAEEHMSDAVTVGPGTTVGEEDSGPVYGPSPAACRRLQQQAQRQQAFCPPFRIPS